MTLVTLTAWLLCSLDLRCSSYVSFGASERSLNNPISYSESMNANIHDALKKKD